MYAAGEIAASITVTELPPSDSCSTRVSFELRYGMKTFLFFFACSARALITLPSAESDLLMLAPSLSLSPVAPVFATRSEPARSTRLMVARTSFCWPAITSFCCSRMMKIECERDDVAFICVAATARAALPWSISFAIFSFVSTLISCRPAT